VRLVYREPRWYTWLWQLPLLRRFQPARISEIWQSEDMTIRVQIHEDEWLPDEIYRLTAVGQDSVTVERRPA
jgi:hypothetical protein